MHLIGLQISVYTKLSHSFTFRISFLTPQTDPHIERQEPSAGVLRTGRGWPREARADPSYVTS
jgi:hypothetical protein